MKRAVAVILLSIVIASLRAPTAHAQEVPLDPTFGSAGRVIPVPSGAGYFRTGGSSRLLALPNGKFLLAAVVGAGNPNDIDTSIIRFNGNGSVDTTFGTNGYAIVDWDSNGLDWAWGGMAIDRTGRIVVAGNTMTSPNYYHDAAIAVLTPAGFLDPTFSGDGLLVINNPDTVAYPYSVVVDEANNIWVDINGSPTGSSATELYLVRYSPTGVEMPLPAGATGDGPQSSLTIDHEGRMVWADIKAVANGVSITVRRFLPDGSLDPAFRGGGSFTEILTTAQYPGAGLREVIVQSSGKIVIVGAFYAWRYLESGELDTSFGTNGHTSVAVPLSNTADAVRDPQDRILIAGWGEGDISQDFIIARFTAEGQVDTSFGTGGVTIFDISVGGNDYFPRAAVMPDGDLVVSGEAGDQFIVGMARFDLGSPLSFIANHSFETGDSKQTSKASKWTGTNLTKDKRTCTAPVSVECVFMFKGGKKEKAQISQTIKPDASFTRPGTALTLRVWAQSDTGNTAVAKVVIDYTDGTKDAFSMLLNPGASFSEFVSAPFTVGKTASKFKVSFKHTGTTGTLYLDQIALIPNAARSRDAVLPVPLPPASGFRGIEN